MHVDGGMADYVCVPEINLVAADGVSLDEAAMVEFLAIGAHAVRRAQINAGDRVLVVGAGPIGLGCALFAKLQGGAVTALDRREDRLAFCRAALGVEHTVVAGTDALARLSELTAGDLYDVVIDATGNAKSIETGFDFVAHGGTYVLVSVVLDTISFSDPKFTPAKCRCWAAATRRARISKPCSTLCARDIFRRSDSQPTAPRSAKARSVSRNGSGRKAGHQGSDRDLTAMSFAILQFGTSRFLRPTSICLSPRR